MIRKRTFGRVNDSFNARTIVIGLLAIGILAAGIGLGTGAIFTDTQQVDANTFSTGTVDISTNPTTALVTFSGMAPGDSVVNDLTVTNSGSLGLRYAVTSLATSSTPELRERLDLTIWDEAQEGDGGSDCNSTAPGTVLYGPGDLGGEPAIAIIGNTAQGQQAGDRTLASGSEVLCFLVKLPIDTDSSYQGKTTTATFTFSAEQTTNN